MGTLPVDQLIGRIFHSRSVDYNQLGDQVSKYLGRTLIQPDAKIQDQALNDKAYANYNSVLRALTCSRELIKGNLLPQGGPIRVTPEMIQALGQNFVPDNNSPDVLKENGRILLQYLRDQGIASPIEIKFDTNLGNIRLVSLSQKPVWVNVGNEQHRLGPKEEKSILLRDFSGKPVIVNFDSGETANVPLPSNIASSVKRNRIALQPAPKPAAKTPPLLPQRQYHQGARSQTIQPQSPASVRMESTAGSETPKPAEPPYMTLRVVSQNGKRYLEISGAAVKEFEALHKLQRPQLGVNSMGEVSVSSIMGELDGKGHMIYDLTTVPTGSLLTLISPQGKELSRYIPVANLSADKAVALPKLVTP